MCSSPITINEFGHRSVRSIGHRRLAFSELRLHMRLYWSTLHNFGDSLNPWLWDRLLPGAFDEDLSEILVGIGTILNHKIPVVGHKHVFGSGYGYGWIPNVHGSDYTIYCVRGPRTASRLNLPPRLAITDPAVLVRRFVSKRDTSSTEIIFI